MLAGLSRVYNRRLLEGSERCLASLLHGPVHLAPETQIFFHLQLFLPSGPQHLLSPREKNHKTFLIPESSNLLMTVPIYFVFSGNKMDKLF